MTKKLNKALITYALALCVATPAFALNSIESAQTLNADGRGERDHGGGRDDRGGRGDRDDRRGDYGRGDRDDHGRPGPYPGNPAPYPERPAPYPERPAPYPGYPRPYPTPEYPPSYPQYSTLYVPVHQTFYNYATLDLRYYTNLGAYQGYRIRSISVNGQSLYSNTTLVTLSVDSVNQGSIYLSNYPQEQTLYTYGNAYLSSYSSVVLQIQGNAEINSVTLNLQR